MLHIKNWRKTTDTWAKLYTDRWLLHYWGDNVEVNRSAYVKSLKISEKSSSISGGFNDNISAVSSVVCPQVLLQCRRFNVLFKRLGPRWINSTMFGKLCLLCHWLLWWDVARQHVSLKLPGLWSDINYINYFHHHFPRSGQGVCLHGL